MWRSVRPSLNLPQLLWSVPLLWYRLISLVSFIAFYIVICLSACCFFGIRTCVSLFSLLHSLCRVVDISSAVRWHRYAFSLVDTFRFLSIFNSHCFWIALIGRSKVCRVLKNAKICWAYSINFVVVVVDLFFGFVRRRGRNAHEKITFNQIGVLKLRPELLIFVSCYRDI